MSKQREGWRSPTRHGIEWSERQRQVLDLLAKGRTNGEIAHELGISLDGAKYHVREILARLGVDTREEAAEWWRQQQGLRARMRVITRFAAAPGILRWAGGAASAAAVAAIALLVIFMAGGDAGGGSPVRIAVAVPREVDDCEQDVCLPQEWDLVVMDGDGANRQTIDGDGPWVDLAWSPDGTHLAAAEPADPEPGVLLHIIDMADASAARAHLPMLQGLAWAPGSDRIYVFGTDEHLELSLDGDVLRTSDSPQDLRTSVGQHFAAQWSPDGRRMLYQLLGRIRVFDTHDLSLTLYDPAPHLEAPAEWGPIDDTAPYALRWLDDHTIQFVHMPIGPETPTGAAWLGTLTFEDGSLSWQAEPHTIADTLLPDWYPDLFPLERLESGLVFPAGLPFDNYVTTCGTFCVSVDGSLQVHLVAHAPADAPRLDSEDPRDRPREWPEGTGLALAWLDNGEPVTIDLPYTLHGPYGRIRDFHGIIYSAVNLHPD